MDVYFPIAEMSANAFIIMGVYTVLSCFSVLFGITGSFFGTPALIFFGVPPVVSLGTQIAYLFIASVSSICAQPTFRLPDYGWTLAMIAGGIVGVGLGGELLVSFQRDGNLTLAISLLLFVCLSTIALLMVVELTRAAVERRTRRRLFRNRSHPQKKRKRGAIAMSSAWLKPLELLSLFSAGALAGVLIVMTSANGGAFIVPVAILIIQMPYSMVSPNSRLSISAIAAFATLWHVVVMQSVDPVLLLLMVLGAGAGVPFGHRLSGIIRPQIARCILAAAALAAATSLAMDLTRPAEFSVDGVVDK
jgi:uncharacterized protein